jgi:hypothetical protein
MRLHLFALTGRAFPDGIGQNQLAIISNLLLTSSRLHYEIIWWAYLDSNQGPTGYEPVALAN